MTKQKREYKNLHMTVRIFDKARNLNNTYDFDDLDDIFSRTPFTQMPIPLNAYRNEYSGDIESRGNIAVGYVTKYFPDTREFEVMILEKYAQRISEYENPIVYPRVKVVGGHAMQVLGLDICSEQYYAAIYK